MDTECHTLTVDVLVVGGGPVGLSLAYQLKHFNPTTTIHVVEQNPKPAQEAFGRAVTFWPRSMEMLDQIGIAEDIIQQCCSVRASAAYDKDGKEVFGRGWSFLEGISDTKWNFATVLRQKYVEDIFRRRLEEMGQLVEAPASFEGLSVDESVELGGYRVLARIRDGSGQPYTMRCRYLVGCDGSRTAVRGAAGIESVGDRTEDKWVRIDGVLQHTTMPKPRFYGAIESLVYGNVLWIPLDHGATRIGFALNEERRKLYSDLTQEVFVKEAKLAVMPFEIEYRQVDWASVYRVGQRIANQFWANSCVFLAGDSCHTHSSGAGQGMNAGQHDAVNLAWKLSMVLSGVARHAILDTYDQERRPNAEQLIRYDEDISILVSGRLPKSWKGDPKEDPHVVLGKILEQAKGFNTGLSLSYKNNLLVSEERRDSVNGHDEKNRASTFAPAIAGFRAPDVKLSLPALLQPIWLQQVTPNKARFYILVFTGDAEKTKANFTAFVGSMQASSMLTQSKRHPRLTGRSYQNGAEPKFQCPPIDFITILSGTAANAWHLLGSEAFGKIYYDQDESAHARYSVDLSQGAVFILRPDGWIGLKLLLGSEGVVSTIEAYFGAFLM